MPDVKATPADLVAFLAAHRPPEETTVEVAFGAGDERRIVELHFQRSMAAFSRYVKASYVDGEPVQAGLQFLMDTVVAPEREALERFIESYPVDAGALANRLLGTYAGGNVELALKNGSRPAGP